MIEPWGAESNGRETGNRKQETGNRKQETGNRKQETGNRKQETGNRKQERVLDVLRKAGDLHWSMVLDLTRELDQWQTYGSPREARAGQPFFPILVVSAPDALWGLDQACQGSAPQMHSRDAYERRRCILMDECLTCRVLFFYNQGRLWIRVI
jgi:hypothetical protein